MIRQQPGDVQAIGCRKKCLGFVAFHGKAMTRPGNVIATFFRLEYVSYNRHRVGIVDVVMTDKTKLADVVACNIGPKRPLHVGKPIEWWDKEWNLFFRRWGWVLTVPKLDKWAEGLQRDDGCEFRIIQLVIVTVCCALYKILM